LVVLVAHAPLLSPRHAPPPPPAPDQPGAVDRPETREQVCALLEGGMTAYRKRGERYGLRFQA
jgi:hypothetical protein